MELEIGPDNVGSKECGYDVCGNKATKHFLLPSHDCLAACDLHHALARQLGRPIDEHAFGADCTMPGTKWEFSDEDGPGKCVWDSDDEVEEEVFNEQYDELLIGV